MSIRISNDPYDKRIDKGVANDFMRESIASAQGRFRSGKLAASEELGDWEDWRSLGEEIRTHTLNHLDYWSFHMYTYKGCHLYKNLLVLDL